MAIKMYCDTCGKPIQGEGARLKGSNGKDATEFQYHSGECYKRAVQALDDLAQRMKAAAEGEQEDSPWDPR